MKNRFPRKTKKRAKKVKSAHDAMTMVQSAMVAAQGAVQMAIIQSTPNRYLADPSVKAMRAAQLTIDVAKGIHHVMSEIKPWQHYAANLHFKRNLS